MEYLWLALSFSHHLLALPSSYQGCPNLEHIRQVLLGTFCFVYLGHFPINPPPFVCAGAFVPARAHSKDSLLGPDDPYICSLHHSYDCFVFSVAFISQEIVSVFQPLSPHRTSSQVCPLHCVPSNQVSALSEHIGIEQVDIGEELVWEETAIWYRLLLTGHPDALRGHVSCSCGSSTPPHPPPHPRGMES